MKKKLLAFLIGTSLILSACGGGDDDASDSNNGEQTTASVDVQKKYAQKCSMCHGVNLNDGRGNVPDISKIGATMTKEEIEHVIVEGIGTMPGGQLKGVEAAAVAEWLSEMK